MRFFFATVRRFCESWFWRRSVNLNARRQCTVLQSPPSMIGNITSEFPCIRGLFIFGRAPRTHWNVRLAEAVQNCVSLRFPQELSSLQCSFVTWNIIGWRGEPRAAVIRAFKLSAKRKWRHRKGSKMEDELGTNLIPNDTPFPDIVRAVRVTGNGNCFYNAISFLLNGKYLACMVSIMFLFSRFSNPKVVYTPMLFHFRFDPILFL